MTPDRAAIAALQQALDDRPGLDHEQTAVLAVTVLQGLGWRPPSGCNALTGPPGGYSGLRAALDQLDDAASRVASELLLGDLGNWKPRGFIGTADMASLFAPPQPATEEP